MRTILAGIALIAVGVVVSAVLTGVPLWLLWNWLCPQLFGLPTVTLIEAFGLASLAGILFRSSSSSSSS